MKVEIALLVLINTASIIESYTVQGRYGHSAVYMKDCIYFYGGDFTVSADISSTWSSELSILPMHSPYSVDDPPWKPASGPQDVIGGPPVFSHVAFKSTPNEMVVLGGVMPQSSSYTTDEKHMAYSYDYDLGRWNSFSLPSGNHLNRQGAASTTTENGITYIWGGKKAGTSLSNETRSTLSLDVYRFDSVYPENSATLTSTGNLVPPLRYGHTQTLLQDRRIVILGGFDSETGDAIPLSDVWIYDIFSASWSQVKASLNNESKPANRSSHSQVLMPDGTSIVIYGGYDGYHVFNDVAVLDTRTWKWTIKNTNAAVQGRADNVVNDNFVQLATLVGTDMIVGFGFTGVSMSLTLMSDIEILDLNTWSWVPEYIPSFIGESGSKSNGIGGQQENNNGPNSPSIAIVAGAVTGGLVVFISILVVIYLLNLYYQRQRKLQNDESDIESITSTKISEHVEYGHNLLEPSSPTLPPPPPPPPPPPQPLAMSSAIKKPIVRHKPLPQPLRINTTNLAIRGNMLPSPWTIRPLKKDEPYLVSPISAVSMDLYPGDTAHWLSRTTISKPDDTFYPTLSSSLSSSNSSKTMCSTLYEQENHSASTFITCQNIDLFDELNKNLAG